jgi:dicarboxylate/amino acid:cation (Na+ or H+) symporter, DAACS family
MEKMHASSGSRSLRAFLKPIHTRISLGLLLGAAAGVSINLLTRDGAVFARFLEPIGRIWLNALIMVVVPLVVSTLALGVAGLGSLAHVGRIGLLTLIGFLLLTTIAASLGLIAVNAVKPGAGLDPEVASRLMSAYRGQTPNAMGLAEGGFGVDTFVRMVPRNPVAAAANGEMLAVIVFALLLGIGMTMISPGKSAPLLKVLDSVAAVMMAIIDLVMRFAPYAVFALIFSVTARFGFEVLLNLIKYILTVIASLAIFQFLVYAVVIRLFARRSPLEFFSKTKIVMLTAFSTSSSNATIPTTLRVTEKELGVRPQIAGFVIPLGATMNMNGTALFEGITVLFLAQVFGVHLAIGQQLLIILLSVITAIGTAGVPGGSIPLLMMVLGMVHVPVEGIAIVLGADRILDMCRTVVNVSGDMVTAAVVERFEARKMEADGGP